MKVITMKKLLFILLTITVISCSKNNDTTKPIDNSNKTTKELVIQNEWIFKQGSVLRLSGTSSTIDTVVRFNVDSTLKVSEYNNDTLIRDFGFIHTNYLIRNDSIYGYLVYYRDGWFNVDSLVYRLKRDVNNDLVGTKEKWFWNNSQYNTFGPVNVKIGIR